MSELWVQRLDDEHEARLAELSARPSATETQAWSQGSLVAEFRRRSGIVERRDPAGAEQIVEEVRQRVRRERGRELYADEVSTARRQAEMRSVIVEGGHAPESSWQLADRHGWGVQVDAVQGSRMAMRMNGAWTGDSDPNIISATEAAEAAKLEANEQAYLAWRRGPGKSIGPPT